MEDKKEILEIISEELEKEIKAFETTQQWNMKAFDLIKVDSEVYTGAWFSFASISTILHHLMTLRALLDNKDEKIVENFIHFTLYQIDQTTPNDVTYANRQPHTVVNDAKRKVHCIFRRLLAIFEQNAA